MIHIERMKGEGDGFGFKVHLRLFGRKMHIVFFSFMEVL